MSAQYRWLCLPVAWLLVGCTQQTTVPQYVANFDQVKVGMPRLKVQELLGEPYRADYRKGVIAPGPSAHSASSSEREELLRALSGIEGGEPAWSERWQFGRFSPADFSSLFSGSDKAFIIWFDQDAAVLAFRKPRTGPFAATQPAARPVP